MYKISRHELDKIINGNNTDENVPLGAENISAEGAADDKSVENITSRLTDGKNYLDSAVVQGPNKNQFSPSSIFQKANNVVSPECYDLLSKMPHGDREIFLNHIQKIYITAAADLQKRLPLIIFLNQ